ncbi:MAG: hypothetical protein JW846_06330 [Dehalococcoidia bacterium]|nr:hypothetical protein [Dehalococcoidia bacterium]
MLFNATADAFHMTPPSTRGKSCAECLRLYALFTREQADSAILHGKQAEVQSRLFQNAYHMGEQFRRDFKVTTTDVMRMGSLIYKMLQIDFEGKPDGNILIHRCFFSAYYSSEVCRLISSLDEGLLTGLAGGGSLAFKQRITEGHECCRAYLQNDGELN